MSKSLALDSIKYQEQENVAKCCCPQNISPEKFTYYLYAGYCQEKERKKVTCLKHKKKKKKPQMGKSEKASMDPKACWEVIVFWVRTRQRA